MNALPPDPFELNPVLLQWCGLAARVPPAPEAQVFFTAADFKEAPIQRSVERRSPRWPLWLELWREIAREPGYPERRVLLDRLRDCRLVAALRDVAPADLLRAMQRSALMAADAFGIPGLPGPGGPANLAELLLRDAFAAGAAEPPAVADHDDEVELPVLLVAGNDDGLVARLRLRRVPVAAGHDLQCSFVAAPGSQLLMIDGSFERALDMAGDVIRNCLKPGLQPAFALAWDLLPPAHHPLWSINGDSAGAAFVIGALFLLRDSVQARIAQWLHLIDWDQAAVTAALADKAGRLRRIDSLPEKLDAWFDIANRSVVRGKVFVAADQLPGLHASRLEHCGTIEALAEALAKHTGEVLSPDQARLLHLLLQDDKALEANPPTRQLLRQVAAAGDKVLGLRGYLLARYAQWTLPDQGMLDLQYANLVLVTEEPVDPDEVDGKGAAERKRVQQPSLLRMLTDHPDVRGWLITGMPGAGKTTMMRHYEMTRARQALQDLSRGQSPGELCLYFALKNYPAGETDPGAWLQRAWRKRYPPQLSLEALIARHHGKVRLLFDGLNEISLAEGGTRQDAVNRLVAWAARHERGIRPPVFSMRELERSVSVGGDAADGSEFVVRLAEVLPWDREQQLEYCRKRLRTKWQALWSRLDDDAKLRALCALPMNLDFQCTLFDVTGQVAANRAQLFSGMAWLWLRREFGSRSPDAFGLLTQDDLNLLKTQSHWWERNLLNLPTGGRLVRALDCQGDAQLRAQGGNVRGVNWGQVNIELDDGPLAGDALEQWAHAVQDLGLARLGEGQGDDRDFEFQHQLWGEFFAARHLAAAGTIDLPPEVTLDLAAQTPIEQALAAAEAADQPLATLQRAAWEETLKLAVQLARDAGPLVQALLAKDPPLAGRAAAGPLRKPLQAALLDELRNQLHKLGTDPATDLRLRIEAGLALGELGDRIRYEERNGCLIPNDSHWVPIEGGDTTIGSDDNDRQAFDDEKPKTRVTVRPFRIAFAPVTNAEFRRFVEAGGYTRPESWGTGDSLQWFETADRRQPRSWHDPVYNNPAQPVLGVCFWEAQAYCAWLTARMADGRIYRLPTEAEWDFAARGIERHRYPWGNAPPSHEHCNFIETRLQRPSPVGVFPRGDRRFGSRRLSDLAGNVWEWTSSRFTDRLEREALMTPTTDAEGNEVPRALRGGFFGFTARYVRGAVRGYYVPLGGLGGIGFRVAACPI